MDDIERALRTHLSYDADTGVFLVKKQYGRLAAGSRAGYKKRDGYRTIGFRHRVFQEHHLAWFFVYGHWPMETIDHINGVRDDNRIGNLRHVSLAENCKNRRPMKNNTTKVQGVYFFRRDSNWKASIHVAGRSLHLGYFSTKEDAIQARKAAEQNYGYHENHGQKL